MPKPRLQAPERLPISEAIAAIAWAATRSLSLDDVIERRMPGNDRVRAVARIVSKSAVNITDTGAVSGILPEQVAEEFVRALAPFSGFIRLRELGVPMPIEAGVVRRVPVLPPADPGLMAWVGEAGVIPVVSSPIGAAVVHGCKLGGIAPISQELDLMSGRQAGAAIGEILYASAGAKLDKSLTDASAEVPEVRPAGLLSGIVPTPSVDFETDFGLLTAAATDWRIPALLIAPERLSSLWSDMVFGGQVAGGRLGPFTLVVSNNWNDPGTIIGLDAANFIGSLSTPEIETSRVSTFAMANADAIPPTQAIDSAGAVDEPGQVNADGGIPIAGGPVGAGTANIIAMNMFQQYSLGLRLVPDATWAMMRPGRIVAISGAAW